MRDNIENYLNYKNISSDDIFKLKDFFNNNDITLSLKGLEQRRKKILFLYFSLLFTVLFSFYYLPLFVFLSFFFAAYLYNVILKKIYYMLKKNYKRYNFLIIIAVLLIIFFFRVVIIPGLILYIITFPIIYITNFILFKIKILEKIDSKYVVSKRFIQFYSIKNFQNEIKNSIFSKIAKLIYPTIQYASGSRKFTESKEELLENDEGNHGNEKNNINNNYLYLRSLFNLGFINNFHGISKNEDSIYANIKENVNIFNVIGNEIKTYIETRGKRKNRQTTNHFYVLKLDFPNKSIQINKPIVIKNKGFYVYNNTLLFTSIIIGIIVSIIGSLYLNNYFFLFINILFIIVGFKIRTKKVKGDKINLENIEFNKKYDVYCSDQVLSRVIVTPAFMDRVIKISAKNNKNYEFLFTNNGFFIKWDVISSNLEADIFKNLEKKYKGFIDFYVEMKEIFDFIFFINLHYYSKSSVGENEKIV